MHFFKDLRDEGNFALSLGHHEDAMRFCFIALIKSELDETNALRNSHRIKEIQHSERLQVVQMFFVTYLQIKERRDIFSMWRRQWISKIIWSSPIKGWVLSGNVNFCIIAWKQSLEQSNSKRSKRSLFNSHKWTSACQSAILTHDTEIFVIHLNGNLVKTYKKLTSYMCFFVCLFCFVLFFVFFDAWWYFLTLVIKGRNLAIITFFHEIHT